MHASPQSGGYRVLMIGGEADMAASLCTEMGEAATMPVAWQIAMDAEEARASLAASAVDAIILLESSRLDSAVEVLSGLGEVGSEIPAVVLTRERGRETPARVASRTGTTHYLDRATPVDELWLTLCDVIERRRVESRLRSSEELHRSTVAALAEGVIVQDRTARIVACNASAERILGRPQHEITGCMSLDPDERAVREDGLAFAAADLPWQIALTTGIPSRDVVMGVHKPDGRLVWISINSQPVFDPEQIQPRLVVSSFSDITARREMEQRLRASLAEKEVLLREIHHRVKNNMQVISSLLALEAMKVDSPEVQELFEDSQNRIRTMALIHEKLYRAADLARINFPQYLRGLAEMVVGSHQHESTARVSIAVVAEPIALNLSEAIPLALITNELLSNACRHAFKGRTGGNVHVTLREAEASTLELVVADDGIGRQAAEGKRGVGLELVQMLTRQLRGELKVDTDERGFRCAVRFAHMPAMPGPEDTKKPQPSNGCG